jgi:hypothetical protein
VPTFSRTRVSNSAGRTVNGRMGGKVNCLRSYSVSFINHRPCPAYDWYFFWRTGILVLLLDSCGSVENYRCSCSDVHRPEL